MPGIFIAAAIVTCVSTAIIGAIVHIESKKRSFFLFALLTLPLSPAVNLLVKTPLLNLLKQQHGIESLKEGPLWFIVFVLFLAPVSEEIIKVLPLAFGKLKALLEDRFSAVMIGMSSGLGFGIGENWHLAWGVAKSGMPAGSMPFYLLGGFIVERSISIFAHGVFTSLALTGFLYCWRKRLIYLAAAIFAHALSNMPALLYQMGKISQMKTEYSLLATFFILWLLFIRLLKTAHDKGSFRNRRA